MYIFQFFAIMAMMLAIYSAPLTAASQNNTKSKTSSSQGYKKIDTASLKKMIDSKQHIAIFDARKKLNGGMIPGAKNLAYDADDKVLINTLKPISKSQTIVVYCANVDCPVSEYLAERLITLGYTNVYKYPDGIQGWIDEGFPVDPAKKS